MNDEIMLTDYEETDYELESHSFDKEEYLSAAYDYVEGGWE